MILAALLANGMAKAQSDDRQVKGIDKENNTDSLKSVLEKAIEADRSVRERFIAARKEHGPSDPETLCIIDEMGKTDSLNQVTVHRFIGTHGFPTTGEYGQKSVYAAFHIIQHAPLDMQLEHYDEIMEAGRKGDLPASSIALFEDRVRPGQGKKQLYGTQIMCRKVQGHDTMNCRLSPLEYPERVDSLRASVQLPPISEYLREMGIVDERFMSGDK